MQTTTNNSDCLSLLSFLLLRGESDDYRGQIAENVAAFDRDDLGQLWSLATSNHVIMRTFPGLSRAFAGEDDPRSQWVENALRSERRRIGNALSFLSPVRQALTEVGDVVVIKSLDHWPDLGSDLDLYVSGKPADVIRVMTQRFRAVLDKRSWGDRLAGKWNFIIPGLHELVEVHIGRLGQTGEQVAFTDGLAARSVEREFGSYVFQVPRPEDRVVISTLQRMYRHFYLRLCDIADMAQLVDSGALDYSYLQSAAHSAGLWEGLASYLVILAQYVEGYRERGLRLPPSLKQAARLGREHLSFRRKFLRIPIFPQAARFYAKEWTRLLFNGQFGSAVRLSLLPGLAVAAALSLKITGSDKGIW